MVCRPHSSIGGQLLQLWLGTFFFLNPLPEFTPRPTTCSDEVITEDSFSPSKISPGLRCLILLLYPEHIKNSPSSNGIICMKGNCPTIYLQLCHSIFSQGHAEKKKKEGRERKDMKKQWDFCMGWWSQHPSCCRSSLFPLLQVKPLFFSLSCNILGGFQSDCTWKLVTKQHIHTFHPHEGSFKFWYTRGLMID